MTTTNKTIHSDSMAIVPLQPRKSSEEFLRSSVKRTSALVAQRSLESAKYAANIFPQISSNFTGRIFFQITRAALSPPEDFKTDSCIGLEIFAAAPSKHKPPILIFSHGYGEPFKYKPLLGELASHGYTVLSLTHPSSFKDLTDGLCLAEVTELMEKVAIVMANNIRYILGEVRTGVLKNLGDSEKIILIGHSLGGASSIMVSRTDRKISGCVNLDGALTGKAKTDGLQQPLLMMIGDYQKMIEGLEQHPEKEAREYAKLNKKWSKEQDTLCEKSPEGSQKILIPGAKHTDFQDEPFREYLAGEQGKTLATAMRVHTIVSSEVIKFLELCLSR